MIRRRFRQKRSKSSTGEPSSSGLPPPPSLRDLDELEGALLLLPNTDASSTHNTTNHAVSAYPQSTFTYSDDLDDHHQEDEYQQDAIDFDSQTGDEMAGLLSSVDIRHYYVSVGENKPSDERRLVRRLAGAVRRGLAHAEEEREQLQHSIRKIGPMDYHLMKRYEIANRVGLERHQLLHGNEPNNCGGAILISFVGSLLTIDERNPVSEGESTSLLLRTDGNSTNMDIENQITTTLAAERGLQKSAEEREALQRSVRGMYTH